MLTVETIGRVRREHFLKGKTIKEIARDLKVSRNTVRRVLRSGETSFEYEREVQPRPKLGRWTAELDELLTSNAAKAAREQLTLIRVFEELRGRGYDGGYDAVRRYARRWGKERGQSTAAAYVPLSFAPGEAYQFDWSHEVVLLNGVTVIVKAAHVRLCHSRMLFVRCYPRETQEMVFDAHDRAFALFKGTYQILFDTGDTLHTTYFPLTAIVSLVVLLSTGESVEAAMVGRDGVVSATAALDGKLAVNRGVVQLAGEVMACDSNELRAAAKSSDTLMSILLR